MSERSNAIVARAVEQGRYPGHRSDLPPEAARRLERYVSELLRWDESMHIVGRSDVELNLSRQLGDSILLLRFAQRRLQDERGGREEPDGNGGLPEGLRVADIGSGVGFPGLVWKILQPHVDITLLERRERMATLLGAVSARMGIIGLEIAQTDALSYEPQHSFDLVTSKAAGRFGALVPMARRLLRKGGAYCTIKGSGSWREELEEKGADALPLTFDEPASSGSSHLLWFSSRSIPGGNG
jgi:16S rRNA (guanine(527)-N(7))-methyltransferase RsmG